jgi:uncharacterized protein YkwD
MSLRRVLVRPRALLSTVAAVLIVVQFLALLVGGTERAALAHAPGNPYFQRTWARTDKPVADGIVARTWMWGPEANTPVLEEPYAESPGGTRLVQYFDKSRMEITHPGADSGSVWYVTNGLLVVELVTGAMQVGDTAFTQFAPANVNVAGDPDDVSGPTYATVGTLRHLPPLADGARITQRVDRNGNVWNDPTLVTRNVTAALRVTVPGLDHQVASPFLDFMRSSGTVSVDDAFVHDRLFVQDFYATGLPISEAYWANVKVGGTNRDVLLQCFERRCLTYTPDNPAAWRVEAGNVGLHYAAWREASLRQGQGTATATATATPTNTPPPGATATFTPTSTHTPTATNTPRPGSTATFSPTATQTPVPTNTPRASPTNTPTPTPTRTPTPAPTPTNTPPPTSTTTNTPTSGTIPDPTESACLNAFEAEVLRLVNVERTSRGLSPLTVSVKLNRAAYNFAFDLGRRNYYPGHPQPHQTMAPYPSWLGGPNLIDRVQTAQYTGYTIAGENIAAGYTSPQAVLDAWMNSAGHRANILDARYTQIGLGYATATPSAYTHYWVQVFGNGNDGAPTGCP